MSNNENFLKSGASESSQTLASWTFRKAPKFFDVVTWTGDGGTRIEKFAQMSEQDRDALMSSFNNHHLVHTNELVISQKLLEEVILTLEHARKFIGSKWISMHPHGIELYDECLKDLKIAIAKAKGE